MAIPESLIAEHRLALESIETLANRDLLRVWRSTDLTDARAATLALLPVVRDLTAAYGDLAAVAAADFYDDARLAAGAPWRFAARPAAVVPVEQSDVMVRWAVTPLWSTDPRFGAALVRLAGGTQRLIRRAERDTIFESGRRDPALARWVRVPAAGACDFCLMLASRGDVYATRESATVVVGREVRERGRAGRASRIVGRTGRARGSRPLGESFHDHCRCRVVPVWTPDDVPDINRQLQDEWDSLPPEQRTLQGWRDHLAATRG